MAEKERYLQWIKLISGCCPTAVQNLAGPVDDNLLARFKSEARIFPGFLGEILRVNDGERDQAVGGIFPNGFGLMALRDIRQVYLYNASRRKSDADRSDMIKCFGPVRRHLFNSARIPFAHLNNEAFWCVDYDPEGNGFYGQVTFEDAEDGVLAFVACSYTEFIDKLIDDFLVGNIIEEDGRLISEEKPWCWWP